MTCLRSWYWLAFVAHWVSGISGITITVNVIICALVPRVQAAEVWTVLGQGDVAAGADAVLVRADIATFILSMWVTFLGALPLVLA